MLKCLIIFTILISSATASSSGPDPDKEFKEGINKLSTFLSQEQTLNNPGQSVHVFNRKIAPFSNLLREANNKLGYKSDLGPDSILNNLDLIRAEYGLDDSFKIELNRLRDYLKHGKDYDSETTMKTSELLPALWGYIAKKIEKKEKGVGEAVSVIFYYLQQNTKESGGCFPGYVGRLMMANCMFIVES